MPPPPLPPTGSSTAAQRKLTRLIDVSNRTYVHGEKVRPFVRPPWRKTAEAYGGRLTVPPKTPTGTKDEAAKEHIKHTNALRLRRDHLLIYSDGSLLEEGRRNVGVGLTAYHAGREVAARSVCMGRKAEVYDAEMKGLAMGAAFMKSYTNAHPEVKHVHIFADNYAALNAIHDLSQKAGQAYAMRFKSTIYAFLDTTEDRTVELGWSPGHKDIPGNERADDLAKRGAEMWAPDAPTLTHAKRITKEKAMTAWTADWAATRRAGKFGAANNFPPTLKPHDHFTSTSREVYGRLVQCRTGHAFIGEYYDRFVPTKRTKCRCGAPFQTREHIIRRCTLYAAHRHILRETHPDLNVADLIGTKDGLETLTKFLQSSGAFTKSGEPRIKPLRPSIDDEDDARAGARAMSEEGEGSEAGSLEGSDDGEAEGEG
jgi:ribonuclease HI